MVSETRLKDMRDDVVSLIEKEIKYRGLAAGCVQATQTLITEPEYEDFNTCIQAQKNFGLIFNTYVNLDDTYDYNDIKGLAKQFVRYLDTNMKKDAFLVGSASVMYREKHPEWDDGMVLQMAIEDLKDMKRNE